MPLTRILLSNKLLAVCPSHHLLFCFLLHILPHLGLRVSVLQPLKPRTLKCTSSLPHHLTLSNRLSWWKSCVWRSRTPLRHKPEGKKRIINFLCWSFFFSFFYPFFDYDVTYIFFVCTKTKVENDDIFFVSLFMGIEIPMSRMVGSIELLVSSGAPRGNWFSLSTDYYQQLNNIPKERRIVRCELFLPLQHRRASYHSRYDSSSSRLDQRPEAWEAGISSCFTACFQTMIVAFAIAAKSRYRLTCNSNGAPTRHSSPILTSGWK